MDENKLNNIFWSTYTQDKEPIIEDSGTEFTMTEMPYNVTLSKTGDNLSYQADGKYFSFTPHSIYWETDSNPVIVSNIGSLQTEIGQKVTSGNLDGSERSSVQAVKYENIFGDGIDINALTLHKTFRKITVFNKELTKPNGAKFLCIKYLINTDYQLDVGLVSKDYKLGENSRIKQSMVWEDKLPSGEPSREEDINVYIEEDGGNFYFVKKIPVEFITNYPFYTNVDIEWGTPAYFYSSSLVRDSDSALIDTNKVAVIYSYMTGGSYLAPAVIVGTVSGTSISWGSASAPASRITNNTGYKKGVSITKLDTNKIMVTFADYYNSNYGYAYAATVSGTTVGTWGTGEVFNSNLVEAMSAVQVGTDKVVLAYNDAGGGDIGKAVVITASGTTLSAGSPQRFDSGTSYSPTGTSIDMLDTNKFVVVFVSNYTRGVVGTISGTSISFGSVQNLYAAASTPNSVSCCSPDTDKLVITYKPTSYPYAITARMYTVSSTTISSYLDTQQLTSNGSPSQSPAAEVRTIDSETVVVTFADNTNSYQGTSTVLTLNWVGETITQGDNEVFESGSTGSYFSLCTTVVDSNHIATFYSDGGDSNYGYYAVGIYGTISWNIDVYDSFAITESASMLLNELVPTASDNITITESVLVTLKELYASTHSDITVTDYAMVELPGASELNIDVFDDFTITENVSAHIPIQYVDSSETITLTESATVLINKLYISVADDITITDDGLADEPFNLAVYDDITLTEYYGVHSRRCVHFVHIIPSDAEEDPTLTAVMLWMTADMQALYENQLGDGTNFSPFSVVVEVIKSAWTTAQINATTCESPSYTLLDHAIDDISDQLGYITNDKYVAVYATTNDSGEGGTTISIGGHTALLHKTNDIGYDSVLDEVNTVPMNHKWYKVMGHEMGHLFGLPDRYYDTEDPGYYSLMGLAIPQWPKTYFIAADLTTLRSQAIMMDPWTQSTGTAYFEGEYGWYERLVDDDITITEDVTVSLQSYEYAIGVNDTIAITESVSVLLNELNISVYDDITISESGVVNVGEVTPLYIDVYDDLTITEDVTVEVSSPPPLNINVYDDLTITESVSVLIPLLYILVDDDISVTESPTVEVADAPQLNVSVYDDITFEDVLPFYHPETITITESVTAEIGQTLSVNVYDNLVITENVIVEFGILPPLDIDVYDDLTISESTTVQIPKEYINVSDTITITENVSTIIPTLNVNVYDDISITESVSVSENLFINVYDDISLEDVLPFYHPETITITDVPIVQIEGLRVVIASEDLVITESVTVFINELIVDTYDDIAITESVAVRTILYVDVSDDITVSESVVVDLPEIAALEIDVHDDIGITENVSVIYPLHVITASDDLAISESVNVIIPTLSVNVYDEISITESAWVEEITGLQVSDLITITENVSVQIPQLYINVSDDITITESVDLGLLLLINVNDEITLTESAGAWHSGLLNIEVHDYFGRPVRRVITVEGKTYALRVHPFYHIKI